MEPETVTCLCFYRCFADEIDLSGLQVDMALRKFQSYFRMPVSSASLCESKLSRHKQSCLNVNKPWIR